MALKGNKGEWSEIYAFLKILGDKKVYAGDAYLKKISNQFYPIIKILRTEAGANFEYEIEGDLILISGGVVAIKMPIKEFTEKAKELFTTIKDSSGSFSDPLIEAFMNSIHCKTLKAKSTVKTDIQVVIHDPNINQNINLGFSIKSMLGGDSTLLNAGKTTNFIFEILDFKGSDTEISKINNIDSRSKIKDRLLAIKKLGGNLKFISPEQDIFKNNLVLIDSLLPNILAEVVSQFYTSNLSTVKLLTDELSIRNPLDYDNKYSHGFYEYKIKRFLSDVALGMMPSKVWGGQYDATGGYLIVKEDGEVLCYHIYNRNQFEDYLFQNTKLETGSSTRHGFGTIYSENGSQFFKLNLQIRFL